MIKRKRPLENVIIEITPMIDMVFILLLFLVLTTTFVVYESKVEVNLPKGKTGTTVTNSNVNSIVVLIDKKENMYLNGVPVTFKTFPVELSKILSSAKNIKSVFIRADQIVPYGEIVHAMDLLRQQGLTNINLLVEKS
ncbi:MAG: hypothetical protein DRP50_05615 [Thermotoga sp.]|nr:biopolymer transporter ExbD [Thermotogota bacterium]RKX53637.1 MAG: hypothetical protein DRP50_05615 [Thermotoga sp.]